MMLRRNTIVMKLAQPAIKGQGKPAPNNKGLS